MHGHALLALPRRAVPYGNRELDAPRIARAGRRDQTQRQARRPRANGLEQLGEEGAAKHRDLGIRVALQRVDRERQAQGFAVPEKRTFGLGQAQLGMIRAECGLLHTSELAVALEQRPELLTPLSLTSPPYLGWLPAGVVTPPMRSIDLSASSTSVTWTPSRWRLASQPAARTRWLVP